MLKIRTKLILTSAVPYSILIIILIAFYSYDTFRLLEKIYKERLALYKKDTVPSFIELINSKSPEELSLIKSETDYGGEKIVFQIFDKNFLPLLNNNNVLDVSQIKNEIMSKSYNYIFEHNHNHYYGEVQILKTKKGNFVFVAAIEAAELKSASMKRRIHFIFAIPLIIGLLIIHSFYHSRIAFKPVKNMIKELKEITSTNLHRRLPLSKPEDEIRELGITLNDMICRLEESFENQKRFIANASHEIKTPLTIIRSQLEMLQEKINTENAGGIPEILKEVDRLANLTKSLLTLARIDSDKDILKVENLRLDELVIESVQVCSKFAAAKNIKLNLNIDDIIEINGDEEKLKCVFVNLIDNAVKYSNENSEVKILLKKDSKKNAVFAVQDSGLGISGNDKPHIFKRFYRSDETRANVPGSGLGLAIVSEIIKLYNGKVEFESELNKGSLFTVTLPLGNK